MVKITKSTLRIPRSLFPSLLFSNVVFSSLSPRRRRPRVGRDFSLFHSRDRSRSFVFVGSSSAAFYTHPNHTSLSLSDLSLLHRRRLRRWPDHGHDRFEVPAHRGELYLCFMRARVKERARALLSSPRKKNISLSEHTSVKRERVRR